MSSFAKLPQIKKAKKIIGRHLVFKNATIEDAEFILNLRQMPERSQFMSKTPPQLSSQITWLNNYAEDNSQAYFVIYDLNNNKIGTIRMYDAKGNAFTWGSWMLLPDLPSFYAIESALIIYKYAISLGFNSAFFEVRRENKSVCRFHENFGAIKINQDDDNNYYELSNASLNLAIDKYSKYLPNDIIIEF